MQHSHKHNLYLKLHKVTHGITEIVVLCLVRTDLCALCVFNREPAEQLAPKRVT